MYRAVIKTATWLAAVGGFAYLTYLLAATSDGPDGVLFPMEMQIVTLSGVVLLGMIAACGHIAEITIQRQQAAMIATLGRHREASKRELDAYLKDEITVWITRSDAHARGRLVEELTETLGARIDAAVRVAAARGYNAGVNAGFAKGYAAHAQVPAQTPHVLGANVFHLAPRTEE